MVLGLFASAVGLIGNVFVARVNNRNTQDVERLRSQSNLVTEAIKTGSSDAACKNLTFLVQLGLLDDPQHAIRDTCKAAPTGPPSLPSNQVPATQQPHLAPTPVRGRVVDETGKPIAGVTLEIHAVVLSAYFSPSGIASPTVTTDSQGYFHTTIDAQQPATKVAIQIVAPHLGEITFFDSKVM